MPIDPQTQLYNLGFVAVCLFVRLYIKIHLVYNKQVSLRVFVLDHTRCRTLFKSECLRREFWDVCILHKNTWSHYAKHSLWCLLLNCQHCAVGAAASAATAAAEVLRIHGVADKVRKKATQRYLVIISVTSRILRSKILQQYFLHLYSH